MTFLGADLHPIAEAFLRYYLGATTTAADVDEATFRAELFALIDRLAPAQVIDVGDDLIIVCRFLDARGQSAAAIRIAQGVDTAAKRATQRAGGTAALDAETRDSGERFTRFADALQKPNVTPLDDRPRAAAADSPRRPSLEERWDAMGDRSKDRLRVLVEQFAPKT